MPTTTLLIGTRKGLAVARRDGPGDQWQIDPLRFPLQAVYAVGVDPRPPTPRMFASTYSEFIGTNLMRSDDLGSQWIEPTRPPIKFPEGTDTALTRIWQIAAGHPDRPGVVFAGTQPSALFRSDDGGETFELVDSLWDHPHRKDWGEGYGGQAIHTLLPHPRDPDRMSVAMSTGGVYRTSDGGESWRPTNRNLKVVFLPDPYPEFGQCVHKVVRAAHQPDQLFLQNHVGVYRSDDDGDTWTSIETGLPSNFGFAVVAHPHRTETAYLFPLSGQDRMPPDKRCRVYRTDDAGESWQPLENGLPQAGFHAGVLRDAMCTEMATGPGAASDAASGAESGAGIYFGTRDGEVYASADDGDSWELVVRNLPDVLCVRAVTN
jgi:hypothetical protein